MLAISCCPATCMMSWPLRGVQDQQECWRLQLRQNPPRRPPQRPVHRHQQSGELARALGPHPRRHPAAALPQAAPADSPTRAVCNSELSNPKTVLGTAGALLIYGENRLRHGCSAICRTCAKLRCTDAGMWWNEIVTSTDSSEKRIDGRSLYATSTRSSCGSAWRSQALHVAPAMTSAPSASSAGLHEHNWKGIGIALFMQTRAALCGTCPLYWNYWMTRGGTRDGYDGAISVYATHEDYQQLKSHASSAAATSTITISNAAAVGLLVDM